MKKKLIITLTACLFAAGSIIHMHLAQNDHSRDFSLADFAAMAQADPEQPNTDDCVEDPNYDCIALHPYDPELDKTRENHKWE